MKKEITDEVFWQAEPGAVFAIGYSKDSEEGVNFQLSRKEVKWVAVNYGNG